jgi:protein SCO1/2
MQKMQRAAFCLALCLAVPAFGQVPKGRGKEQAEPAGLAPRYLLMDHRGSAVTNEDFRGRFQLISFGYTSCPDVCPTTLLEMKEILQELGDKAGRLQPIFVTVDPERDTAQVLREYTGAFDPRILGLTGTPDLIRRAADTFKVRYEKVRQPGAPAGSYTVDHSAGMYLLGPDGRFLAKFAYATPPREVTGRIRALMEEIGTRSPGPVPRGASR